MQPQDNPRAARPSAVLTVPAEIVGDLREGLHLELGGAAHAIEAVVVTPGHEAHPELYEQPLEHLDRVRALLDVIGWGRTDTPTAVDVDLRKHRWALLIALRSALAVRDGALQDVMAGRVPERAKRIAVIERARVLRAYLTDVEARSGA